MDDEEKLEKLFSWSNDQIVNTELSIPLIVFDDDHTHGPGHVSYCIPIAQFYRFVRLC